MDILVESEGSPKLNTSIPEKYIVSRIVSATSIPATRVIQRYVDDSFIQWVLSEGCASGKNAVFKGFWHARCTKVNTSGLIMNSLDELLALDFCY